MYLTRTALVDAIKLFNQHFDLNTTLKQHQFILGGDAVGLISGAYKTVPTIPITIYLRRDLSVPQDATEKHAKLIGLFTGETIANYGGITEITVQINEYTFKVKPQPADHEDSGFDTISRIIDVFG